MLTTQVDTIGQRLVELVERPGIKIEPKKPDLSSEPLLIAVYGRLCECGCEETANNFVEAILESPTFDELLVLLGKESVGDLVKAKFGAWETEYIRIRDKLIADGYTVNCASIAELPVRDKPRLNIVGTGIAVLKAGHSKSIDGFSSVVEYQFPPPEGGNIPYTIVKGVSEEDFKANDDNTEFLKVTATPYSLDVLGVKFHKTTNLKMTDGQLMQEWASNIGTKIWRKVESD